MSADRPLEDHDLYFKTAWKNEALKMIDRMSTAEIMQLVAKLAAMGYSDD